MEQDTKKRILDWCHSQSELFAFIFDTDLRIHRLRKYGGGKYRPAGLSDLVGNLVGGRAVYIEVKDIENKTKNQEQLDFLAARRKEGAFACKVNSIEELKRELLAEGYWEWVVEQSSFS